MKDNFPYDKLIEHLYKKHSPDTERNTHKWKYIAEVFALYVQGNALAQKYSWDLKGIEAIEYAIIQKYSWPLHDVRDLIPRDKWIAIHAALKDLTIPEEPLEAWCREGKPDLYPNPLDVWQDHSTEIPQTL